MAKQNLASMSIDALLKLRDEVISVLSDKAEGLKAQLSRLMPNGADQAKPSKIRKTAGKRSYRKAAAKYRDRKTGETWAGRGGTAKWLTAYEKAGRKRDEFLINKPAKKKAKKKKKRKAN